MTKKLIALILFFIFTEISFAEKISIGVIAPLTGNQAQLGEAISNGIQLAKKDKPELFDSVNFILEDSQLDNNMAIAAFQKLVKINKVKLVYIFGHGQSHTLAPLAEVAKVALVACTGEKDIEANRDYVIRFFVPHEWLGYILLKHLKSKGYKRLGMIKSELSFIENIFRGIKLHLNDDQSLEIVEVHSKNDTDFRTSITKAKRKNFDVLGVFLGQGQIAPFYHQLIQLQLDIPTFGTHAFESAEEIRQAGKSIEGAVLPAITANSEFKSRYKKTFGHETFVTFAANAYDFAVLAAKLSKLHTTAPALVAAFKKADELKGASGEFGYQNTDDFGSGYIFPVAIKQVQEGKLVNLE